MDSRRDRGTRVQEIVRLGCYKRFTSVCRGSRVDYNCLGCLLSRWCTAHTHSLLGVRCVKISSFDVIGCLILVQKLVATCLWNILAISKLIFDDLWTYRFNDVSHQVSEPTASIYIGEALKMRVMVVLKCFYLHLSPQRCSPHIISWLSEEQ